MRRMCKFLQEFYPNSSPISFMVIICILTSSFLFHATARIIILTLFFEFMNHNIYTISVVCIVNLYFSPVDCIHWTSAAQLSLLEDEMHRVERVNVRQDNFSS